MNWGRNVANNICLIKHIWLDLCYSPSGESHSNYPYSSFLGNILAQQEFFDATFGFKQLNYVINQHDQTFRNFQASKYVNGRFRPKHDSLIDG